MYYFILSIIILILFTSINHAGTISSPSTEKPYAKVLYQNKNVTNKSNATEMIMEISKTVEDIWKPETIRRLPPHLNSTINRLMKAYNLTLEPFICNQRTQKRGKRDEYYPSKPYPHYDPEIEGSRNVSTRAVNNLNNTIPFVRLVILGPLVAATTIMARAGLLQTPFVLFPVLIARTILGVIDGTLSYLSTAGISDDVRKQVRAAFDEIVASRGPM